MVAVIETFRKIANVGGLKMVIIQSSAACASSYTIDLKSDSSAGVVFEQVLNTVVQDDAGADKDSTWDPATGIITLGTLVTGIHNILVIGY